MARSNSVINVSIIGDAKKLIGAVGEADAATGGLVKSAAKVFVAGKVVSKGFDLVNDSLAEADRKGDAIKRLERSIGKIDTAKLADTADNFLKIGGSSQDVLELEAAYADLATSAGIAAPDIAANAEQMAATALAAAQVHDADPAAIIDALGKAAGGATRGLKPYGVDLTEAAVQQEAMRETGKTLPKQLTDTELATARVNLILQGFNPLMQEAVTGTGDLADKQGALGAKAEELGGKLGTLAEGPLADVLQFILDEIDAIPSAIDGFNLLGQTIVNFGATVLTPLAQVRDVLANIVGLLDQSNSKAGFHVNTKSLTKQLSDREINAAYVRERERNGLGI